MSYRSHVAASSRVFDHLYDPLFTTSDPKNVYKEDCIALTRSAPIRVFPVYKSMFSELCYEERNSYAYQKNTLPFQPGHETIINEKYVSVTGADRSKFFSNPTSNTRTINVGLMADKYMENVDEVQRQYRTTSIQTLYRESSAQTKSWLPECFSNEIPELVFVADMISDSVTYPGLKEVEIIERARKRRAWEIALPPIKRADEIPTRVAAMEAFEWEEWIAREKDINEYQQARLQIVADLIEQREQKHKTNTDLKIENCKKRELDARNRQKNILINNFQRSMRKIALARRKESMKNIKDDPVLVHYDKKSDFTLPKIQIGINKTKKRPQIEFSSEFKNKYSSIEQGNTSVVDVQKYMKGGKPELWTPKGPLREIQRGIWNENYLKRLHETLKQFRRKKHPKRKLIEKIPSQENIPAFLPAQAFKNDLIDENYEDNTLVQKTIKGRAIQSMLQKGMKKAQDAIQEAKETHSIAAVRKLFSKEFSQQIDCQEEILQEYRRIDDIIKNDKKLQDELKKIESKDIKKLLDFFGKELNRLQSEKQAHALFLLSERERYRREAEKLGEQSCEEQFKNDSVTLYLENILLEGINLTFDESSRRIIREMARKIAKSASNAIDYDENDEKPISSDEKLELVEEESKDFKQDDQMTKFLNRNVIPQILYEYKNEKLILQQREYLMNAHQFLFKEEFMQARREEENFIASTIFNEILENVFKADFSNEKLLVTRQDSSDAELLATQIVQEILNDIINNDLKEDDAE